MPHPALNETTLSQGVETPSNPQYENIIYLQSTILISFVNISIVSVVQKLSDN
jgi:hypothetical protein